jgi:hypothetical protein
MNAIESADRFFAPDLSTAAMTHPLTALVYDEGFAIGNIFRTIAANVRNAGLRLGGVGKAIDAGYAQSSSV